LVHYNYYIFISDCSANSIFLPLPEAYAIMNHPVIVKAVSVL